MEIKKQILKLCMQNGFLLDKDILEALSSLDEDFFKKIINILLSLKIKERVITKVIFNNYIEEIKKSLIKDNKQEQLGLFFKNIGCIVGMEDVSFGSRVNLSNSDIKILSSSIISPKKIEVQDFVKHYRSRYEKLKNILQTKNLGNLKSLRRLTGERDAQQIIVSIADKRTTKNKNLMFEVEDMTGRTRVLINANREDLYEKCKDILPDDIVAFSVSGTKEMLFANEVFFPDAFLIEKRKYDKEVLVAFTSDIHIGSKMFLEDSFLKFIKWLNGEDGDEEQKNIAKKVKYLFLVGDNVDGIGIFPDQERLLNILETTKQYKKLSDLLNLIRKDVKIIISPGQHDAVWVGEPQPAIGINWAPELHKMENVFLATNPCTVEIEGGFKILMYHGASFHGIIEEMSDIRINFGHNSPTTIVKELLKRRHLAPIHGSCDYVPSENDPLVIDIIPDIVATGDLHRPEVSVYNNILLIASSCWQSITPFEEKVGNNPDPCKVPIFNLKTREVKIMDFSNKKKESNNGN
jgi:DNA polymerase II small subunit